MLRLVLRISPLALLLFACTQAPSQVDMKGQNTFGRNSSGYGANNNSYSGNSNSNSSYQSTPVYTNTEPVQSVPSGAIGVNDLSPPVAGQPDSKIESKPHSENIPPNSPFAPQSKTWALKSPDNVASMAQADAPVQAKPDTVAAAPVNAWTQKPRFSDNSSAADDDAPVKPAAAAPKATGAGFMWPVSSRKILSGFGPKGGGKANDGIDIASAEGEPVWAAADGEVVYVGNEISGYGNMVLIKHAGGKTSAYAHLNRIAVDKYGRVKQGDIIGYVGTTGNVKEPQLHFAIRNGKEPVDPQKLLKS